MATSKKPYERPVIQRLNAGVTGKFGQPSVTASVSNIDGNSVDALIQQFGSPLFVISENTLTKTYRDAERAFTNRYPKVQLAWSYKTNYLDAVCRIYHRLGAWAEVVSGFEYEKALANGVEGSKIIFNGPGKSAAELEKAIHNQSLIHIDHADEFYVLRELVQQNGQSARVAIRVNMDCGIYPQWDRFGFNLENGEAFNMIEQICSVDEMHLEGLHCHIGTFVLSTQSYSIAAAKMSQLALQIKKQFSITIKYLDLGGGFASKNTLKGSFLQGQDANPSIDKYAEAICSAILKSGFNENELPLLILESGRALIDESGYLLGSVLSHKRLGDGRSALILDFGVNVLFTAFWYDHKISTTQVHGQWQEDMVLYGPLCMNIDVVREHITLPPLNKGDKVVVHNTGAYNMTQWMQFISMRPAVVLIDRNEKPHTIRLRETTATIQAQEKIPNHLTHG